MKRSDILVIFGQRDSNTHVEQVITRAAGLVPSTLDAEARSVRCCLTTEDPVRIYDWRMGKIVLEVLMVDQGEYEDQTPLLRDHNQYNVEAVIGSITDVANVRDELMGTLTFGEDLDERAEAIWKRVKQGHLRRVSVGYDYTNDDYATIAAGESLMIGGRKWTAPKTMDMRVVKRWRLREVSVVVIPADKRATMRSQVEAGGNGESQRGTLSSTSENSPSTLEGRASTQPDNGTNVVDELLKFLLSRGLPAGTAFADNSAAFAWARQNLHRDHYQSLHDLVRQHNISGFVATDFVIPIRSDSTLTDLQPLVGTIDTRSAEDGVRQERERQTAIRNLATLNPQIPADVVQRSLDEGHTLEQAATAFRSAIQSIAEPPVPPVPSGAPAGHIRGGITLTMLQAGLMERCGITPDSPALRSTVAENVFSRRDMQLGWLRGAGGRGEARNGVEAAFDGARNHRLASGSLMRFCEAMLELSGERMSFFSDDEIIERSFSNGNFSALFGAVVHMMMVQGYTETPATYDQFMRIKDVPDFRPNKEGMANGVGRLKKQGINDAQAALLNIDSPTIAQVAAERYAGQLIVSDQVIINDSFDVLDTLPREVGVSARQIPSDLAFALLLGNLNLSDSQPLFIDGTNYITAGSLDDVGLNAATVLLKNQKVGKKRITVAEAIMLHGTLLAMAAKKVITSSTSPDGTDNVMRNSYRRVEDNAVDLGVDNPANNDATIAGTPNSYYLFGEPRRSLVMAFRRGTNRGPITRSGRLPIGSFGNVWDVLIDVGVAASGRIGVVRVDVAEAE